jgi:hypothetical protein
LVPSENNLIACQWGLIFPEARTVGKKVLSPYIEVPKADTMTLAAGHKVAGGKICKLKGS